MTQTIKFASFPFTYKGFNFVSKVAETNRFLPQIMMMGEDFITMNKGAIDECMTLDENSSIEYVISQLEYINAGGTEMFLELAGE
jgi:hypothetical protein